MTRTFARGSRIALFLGLLLASAPLRAQGTLPDAKIEGSVQYLSGGIGADEAAAINAESSGYALTVLFAESRNGRDVYLASVVVTLRDARGKLMLDTVTEGPYLLINLPAGRYQLIATHDGIPRQLALDIKSGVQQHHSLVWPYTEQARDPEPVNLPATEAPNLEEGLPPLRTVGGIPYRSGGVGAQESKALRSQFGRYSLSLTFAANLEGRNAFLATVALRILDAAGSPVVELTTDGPFLLIDLPPGRYEVIANFEGREQRAKLQVTAGKPLQRTFLWSAP